MRTVRLLMAVLALASMSSAIAQTSRDIQQKKLEENHKLFFFGPESEAVDSSAYAQLISRFYMDQFRHSQDPRAPYFMLMSRNGNMAMGIGGDIQAIASYDWDGSIAGDGFAPYSIPIPLDRGQINSLQGSVHNTALFFSVFGTDKRFGNYQLYIMGKFNGGSGRSFVLKKAYATVGDWTLGYATSTFVDPQSQPATVETDGPNSETGGTRFLLRYMHTFKKDFTAAISAEMPDDEIPTTSYSQPGTMYAPNVAAFLQFGKPNQHIRLSGIMKNMRYRNMKANENGYATGWGVNLSTVFNPVAPLTVYAAANTGCGIGSMVNDLSDGDLDLLGYNTPDGKMYAPKSYGWYAALQYNFRPNLFSTVMFSQERMLPKHNSIYGPDQYKYGLYGTANVFWNITERCQLGAEINIGKRCNMDGTNRLGYRAGLMAEFSF